MERIWSGELAAIKSGTTADRAGSFHHGLLEGFDRDDERSQLPEEEQQALLDHEVEMATAATAERISATDPFREKALLNEMQTIAEQGRASKPRRFVKSSKIRSGVWKLN